MFVNVPDGLESLTKSGSNPISAVEIVDRLRAIALDLQRKRVPQIEPPE
jgi:hypothetical protein